MPPRSVPPEYLDEHHQRISEFAAEYMDEDERDDFVGHVMQRRGYKPVQHTSWEPPEDPKGAKGGQPGGKPGSGYFKR